MGLSARCGRCRCECDGATNTTTTTTTTTTTHGDVVRNRNNDAPDAVLEGLAMAGLVAILRQLGDLAELAAEVFDDMQDQVMAASARGRRLAVRARQLLEADLDLHLGLGLPPPSTDGGAGRLGCRAHLRLRVRGGTPPMPRLVVQRIRRCRGPPRLSLLDKFDAAGEGACLKRYTDPSFFFRAHSEAHGTLRVTANGSLLLKPMETSRPKFQTTLKSEPPESAHTVTDCKSEAETETETDASEAPSPSFLSMLRQLKQHRRQAGAGSLFRMQQQTAVHRGESSPLQLNMEQKLQGGGTAQPSPSELERTSSFEAWLSPDARRFPTATPHHHHHEHDEIILTQEPPDDGASATTCGGSVSHVVITTSNAALSSSATGLRDCSPPEPEAIPTPRPREEAFLPTILLHSDPVYSSIHSLLSENEKCFSCLENQESIPGNVSVDAEIHHPSASQCSSNSNSSSPETCTAPDSNSNLLLPGILVLKPAENSSPEDAKADTAPPLPPIPPMQWLPEKVHAASPKHRALWKKSLELGRADRSNDALHSVRTQVAEKVQAISQAASVSNENENANANASRRDETKCSQETSHPHPFLQFVVKASSESGIVLKAGEFPMPEAQADTCFQQQGRQQFGSSGHSDEKPSQEQEASDDSSNLQNESVFLSAVQELAKMSPPPSVLRPKYSLLLDAGSHGRITLRNGPSPIHPSRNILDSRSALTQQIKDIAMAGNPSFKLKPVSGASSPQSPMIGSPTNPKVATILQRADDIRQAHANSNDVDTEESWSDDSE